MDWNDLRAKLREPFTPEEIEWRVGSTTNDKTRGLALAYVTNRAIQDRLDDVFGVSNWQNEFKPWKTESQICGISVWDEDKNQWITKWDGADDSQTEAVKGGLSDSMKRAAYQWGIGRYLYKLPQVWVAVEQYGKSVKLKEIPKLPEWALPKGYQNAPAKPAESSQRQSGKATTKPAAALASEPIKENYVGPDQDSKPALSAAQIKRFYAIVGDSGANNDVIKLIIGDVLYGKMCVDIATGKILWSNMSKADYDALCALFESGRWEEYFARMMESDGGAQDLRDVG
jgi:hypothetical protein